MLVITVAGKPSAAEDLLIPLTNLSEEHVDDAIRTERAGHGRANRRRLKAWSWFNLYTIYV